MVNTDENWGVGVSVVIIGIVVAAIVRSCGVEVEVELIGGFVNVAAACGCLGVSVGFIVTTGLGMNIGLTWHPEANPAIIK